MVLRPHFGSASDTLRLLSSAGAKIPATLVAPVSFGLLSLHGTAQGYLNEPYGSFRDFAHYQTNALDPAMVLVRSHNGGATTSDVTQTSGYRRYYAIASTPLDYPVSGGKKAWSRAAYASIGLKFKGLVNAGYEFINAAQFEIAKYAATAPVDFHPARALNCVVVPKRVNFIPNPSLAVDATGWLAAVGGARVVQGTGWAFQVDGSTNTWLSTGAVVGTWRPFWSGSVVVSGPAGRTINVQAQDGSGYITPSNSIVLTGTPQTVVLTSNAAAPGTSPRILVYPTATGGAWTSGQMLTATNALLEEVSGTGVPTGGYFDGASGSDYIWGGVANASESFYYPDRVNRSYLISKLLEENCPLGVTPGVPQFGVLPTIGIFGDVWTDEWPDVWPGHSVSYY